MKRLISTLLLAMLVLAFAPKMAFAGRGPHEGNYTATTDACAGCHRAHTATSPSLLMQPTEALCLTCHGSTAAGAQTNVVDGVYGQYRTAGGTYTTKDPAQTLSPPNEGTVGAPLNGGGFSFYRVQGQAAFTATTSWHDISGASTAAWGYGTANTGQTSALANGLTCGSCHEPHGSTTNYRILRPLINNIAVNVSSLEGATSNYTAEQWSTGMSAFCGTCHPNYNGDGAITTGGVTHYRHEIDMNYSVGGNVNPETVGYQGYTLPLANNGVVVCTTCHLSHGSSAAQGQNSTIANIAGDSSLLRLDNRGVCEVCHQK